VVVAQDRSSPIIENTDMGEPTMITTVAGVRTHSTWQAEVEQFSRQLRAIQQMFEERHASDL
jgi:hypothetical protein